MSKHFEKVKDYYERGLWSVEKVRRAVAMKWITEEEYTLIVGFAY